MQIHRKTRVHLTFLAAGEKEGCMNEKKGKTNERKTSWSLSHSLLSFLSSSPSLLCPAPEFFLLSSHSVFPLLVRQACFACCKKTLVVGERHTCCCSCFSFCRQRKSLFSLFFFDFCSFLFSWSILWTAWTSSTSCPPFTSSEFWLPCLFLLRLFSLILFLSLLPLTSLHIFKQRGQNFSGSSSSLSVFLLDLCLLCTVLFVCRKAHSVFTLYSRDVCSTTEEGLERRKRKTRRKPKLKEQWFLFSSYFCSVCPSSSLTRF